MATGSQQPKRLDGVLSSLNTAFDAMNIAKGVVGHTPAKVVFASLSALFSP